MKRILKLFSINQYSFSTKVILSFLIFLLVFMLIRTFLSVPKIEKRALDNEIEYITKSLMLLQEKIKIIGKSLKMQRELEIELSKTKIENEIKELALQKNISSDKVINFFKNSEFLKRCSYKLSSNDLNIKEIKKDDFFSFNNNKLLNKWQKKEVYINSLKDYRVKPYYFFNYKIKNILLSIACSTRDLNPGHMPFEISLKEHIHVDLIIDSELSNTKTTFVWINPNLDKNDNSIFYEEDKEKRKEKYNVSMLSNIRNISTGNLTTKEVFEVSKSNKPISHKLNLKDVLTWIINLSGNPKRPFFIIYTIDKQEIEKKNKAKLLFLLPESLIAIGISFILLILLFRRILKNIDTLTKTALLVNQGKKNIRSSVRGDDDIGVLGKSFDSMLDFFENSIETLDKKVEEKTKEISKSLEEKEILLKEIHHRVKNNLALTISLIELQEEDVDDKRVKKVLVDIKERIYTMELLHRKLYESTNLNDIPFRKYVIDLVKTISRSYDIENRVLIDIKVDDIDLNIETAMPYGIILNELVTNAFKYGFKGQENEKLKIRLTKEENILNLVVKDNGKGLDKEFSQVSETTLGLKLINTIVSHQLFGTVSYQYKNGAEFIITGKIKKYN
ncbi:histidine kinase [Halarcobacter mediterraneus]|uniref:histidine kinase n=1 Tax=Halarcobacter mediterraneus TaxID=2023153 RepID=A0A4Q1ATN1_9BACT|nr:histidine kinase dimerization/phosphoacceptor domain -containing protein [Halarcobacter mediterraneus]RXK13133.1 histidine kinase [Halarcobacter mediterraneus]